jgi:two-component system chemotaxis response regulator CheB
MPYEAVVIGASAGGLEALKTILPALPPSFALPIAIVQHIGEHSGDFMVEYLNTISHITVKEAEDKEPLRAAHAYFAPAGYHLLIEADHIFSLTIDSRVNYSCPSIDVLFESAADAFAASLIGIVLTGANSDGSHGLQRITARSGLAIVQNPDNAQADCMPKAALAATHVDP